MVKNKLAKITIAIWAKMVKISRHRNIPKYGTEILQKWKKPDHNMCMKTAYQGINALSVFGFNCFSLIRYSKITWAMSSDMPPRLSSWWRGSFKRVVICLRQYNMREDTCCWILWGLRLATCWPPTGPSCSGAGWANLAWALSTEEDTDVN